MPDRRPSIGAPRSGPCTGAVGGAKSQPSSYDSALSLPRPRIHPEEAASNTAASLATAAPDRGCARSTRAADPAAAECGTSRRSVPRNKCARAGGAPPLRGLGGRHGERRQGLRAARGVLLGARQCTAGPWRRQRASAAAGGAG
eukprot:scaffold828_cov319-Pinguiococcus_pyrenoidosus.AAC.2